LGYFDRGGDILIIDDPIKANDANSQVALTGADEWFHNTALSRLDSAKARPRHNAATA
jgi:hypothetical protein